MVWPKLLLWSFGICWFAIVINFGSFLLARLALNLLTMLKASGAAGTSWASSDVD